MSAELKPCPFCGPGQSVVGLWHDDVSQRWRVGCGRCGCSTGISPRDKTETPAIKAWNTRAPQWLPIESAPKDGAAVLATSSYMTGENGELVAWAAVFDQGRERWAATWDGEPLNDATHWQPLPAPPEVQP